MDIKQIGVMPEYCKLDEAPVVMIKEALHIHLRPTEETFNGVLGVCHQDYYEKGLFNGL